MSHSAMSSALSALLWTALFRQYERRLVLPQVLDAVGALAGPERP